MSRPACHQLRGLIQQGIVNVKPEVHLLLYPASSPTAARRLERRLSGTHGGRECTEDCHCQVNLCCCSCHILGTHLPACSVHCQSTEQQPLNPCRAKKQEKAAKGGAGSQLKSNAAASNVVVSLLCAGLNLRDGQHGALDMHAAALCMS